MLLSAIKGQPRAVRLLERSLASARVPHAYLFTGIEGCGRERSARALVQVLFCREKTACGECPSCRKLQAGSHPDLHLLEADGAFIKIDQIRELQRELSLKPYEAPRKGCIIRQAHRMNPSAANALLKTLEEPPGSAIIFLITDTASSLLPTIRSRCQEVGFSPLPVAVMAELLTERGVESEIAGEAAVMAEGSMSRALELASCDAALDQGLLLGQLENISLGSVAGLFALSEEYGADRDRAMETVAQLQAVTRDIMLIQQGGEPVHQSLAPPLRTLADTLAPDVVLVRIDAIGEALAALRRNANVRLTLDVLFMRLAELS
jgi:DNA polymerase-3 subunit delta'